jgi:hypothetical protein
MCLFTLQENLKFQFCVHCMSIQTQVITVMSSQWWHWMWHRDSPSCFSPTARRKHALAGSCLWVAHRLGCGWPSCCRKEGLVCLDLPFSWDWLPSWRPSFIWLQYQVSNKTGCISDGNEQAICRGLRNALTRNCWDSFENTYACVTCVIRK